MSELKNIYKAYCEKFSEVRKEYKTAVEDYLKQEGLSGDVYNKDGKLGRLVVDMYNGEYEIRFYSYKKNGELSQKASGYIWIWLPDNLKNYRKADTEGE